MSPRTVFSPYVRLFAVPGSAAFSFAGWVARLPAPMLGLGAVFLVEGETGSYGLAGAVSGTLALAFGGGRPAVGARDGPAGPGRGACAGPWCAFLVARRRLRDRGRRRRARAGAGSCSPPRSARTGPNIGSLVRARWSAALDPAARQTAFAFEAVVDEVVFVVGPPLVTLLATLIAPPVGFLTGVVLGAVGGFWLAAQRAHRAAGARRSRRARRPARSAGAHADRCWSSSVDLPGRRRVVRRHRRRGRRLRRGARERRPSPGSALAVFAGGSLVAGLVYGLARLPGTLAAPLRRHRGRLRAGGAAAVGGRARCRCWSAAASSPA